MKSVGKVLPIAGALVGGAVGSIFGGGKKQQMPTPTPAPTIDQNAVAEAAQRDRLEAIRKRRGSGLTSNGTLMTGGNRTTLG